ncbi:hypothetical protein, partial [Bacillus sp. AFS017336]|uniref:hypothetical protein n=1 Tax=Bacillus sp. AFS017336 TaxID=2033489 RepID=UPI001C54EED2
MKKRVKHGKIECSRKIAKRINEDARSDRHRQDHLSEEKRPSSRRTVEKINHRTQRNCDTNQEHPVRMLFY